MIDPNKADGEALDIALLHLGRIAKAASGSFPRFLEILASDIKKQGGAVRSMQYLAFIYFLTKQHLVTMKGVKKEEYALQQVLEMVEMALQHGEMKGFMEASESGIIFYAYFPKDVPNTRIS